MSTHFNANQYEDAFIPHRIKNWEVPKGYKEHPHAYTGYTKIIGTDRGHLTEAKSNKNPWGNYVGTWDMPRQIPGQRVHVPTARSANAHERLTNSAKEAARVLNGQDKNVKRQAGKTFRKERRTPTCFEIKPAAPADIQPCTEEMQATPTVPEITPDELEDTQPKSEEKTASPAPEQDAKPEDIEGDEGAGKNGNRDGQGGDGFMYNSACYDPCAGLLQGYPGGQGYNTSGYSPQPYDPCGQYSYQVKSPPPLPATPPELRKIPTPGLREFSPNVCNGMAPTYGQEDVAVRQLSPPAVNMTHAQNYDPLVAADTNYTAPPVCGVELIKTPQIPPLTPPENAAQFSRDVCLN